jgi:hypothetical protein
VSSSSDEFVIFSFFNYSAVFSAYFWGKEYEQRRVIARAQTEH